MALTEQLQDYINKKQEETDFWYYQSILLDFLNSVGRIPFPEDAFRGNIAIIGQGQAFPERVFLNTPQSDFTIPREEIDHIICCDTEFYTKPAPYFFDVPVRLGDEEALSFSQERDVTYFPRNGQYILSLYPKSCIDLVTFFRIPDFVEQLPELLTDASTAIKSGGYVIGSGSSQRTFSTLDRPGLRALAKKTGFTLNSYTPLSDFDATGYPFSGNIGVVLQKK